MGVQHNNPLDDYYREATEQARAGVAAIHHLGTCSPDSPDYPGEPAHWREVWRVDLGGTYPVQILVGVPTTFPDELPTAYLPLGVADSAAPFPHLNRERILCTFDTVTSSPDADQPTGVALAVIERASAVWEAGAARANLTDFADELKAYWDDVATINALSIVPPHADAATVAVLGLSPGWGGFMWLFADTAAAGRLWLGGLGYAGNCARQGRDLSARQVARDAALPFHERGTL